MPLYSYQCEECEDVFEVRASIKEKESGLEPECPKCHSKNNRQLISAGLLLRGGNGAGRSLNICSPEAGPGCC